MHRIIFTLLFIIAGNSLFAQYIHYSDKRKLTTRTEQAQLPARPASNPSPRIISDTVRDTVKVIVRDTVRVVVRDTVKIKDTVRLTDTIRVVIRDTIRSAPVYHKWPDRCPGLSGAVPVLTNYVPKEIIPKLTEIFKGHLYSITSIKVANNKLNYKMKVCEDGQIKFEYADENGELLPNHSP